MTKLRTLELSVISSRSNGETSTISQLKSAYVVFFIFFAGLATAQAQTFTSLLSFDGTDGAFPQGTLVEGGNGKFYGTTPYAGVYGVGTVFEVTPWGKLTTLHNFNGTNDGGAPYGGLIRARTGNLYGVASGAFSNVPGTVFEITLKGKLTTIYTFCSRSNCADGATPYAALVEGSNGNFYGTTSSGGAYNHGTIFEVTPEGNLTTLYSFCTQPNCSDGEGLLGNSLVQGRNGNFYGTTPLGGSHGSGTVFEMTPEGKLTTLHSFCSQRNCTDGGEPLAGLVQGRNGNFYGTTTAAGPSNSGGTVFEITPTGKLTTLYDFEFHCSPLNCADGGSPEGALVQASNGNFYGTTYAGGAIGGGTIFEITPKGKLTTLYSFCVLGCVKGSDPVAGLMRATTGKFYGTTFEGGFYGPENCGSPYGDYGCGTLFELDLDRPDNSR